MVWPAIFRTALGINSPPSAISIQRAITAISTKLTKRLQQRRAIICQRVETTKER